MKESAAQPLPDTPAARVEILLPGSLPHGFDYAVPGGMAVRPGDYVTVSFGKRQMAGVAWGEGNTALDGKKIKPIEAHHTELPPLSPAMRDFLAWSAWYTMAPPGALLKMVLPVPEVILKKDAKMRRYEDVEKKSFAQPSSHRPIVTSSHRHIVTSPHLSPEQQAAADRMAAQAGKFSVTLLDGVTGSGKTEVYFDLIGRVMSGEWRGMSEKADITRHSPHVTRHASQVLVLLPEIALSVQWLERFEARFGFTPTVWHSGITKAAKKRAWLSIARGEARVVVGARSALFLPYRRLSAIIVDEEHDASYKQEEGVVYHARDLAVARAKFENIPAVLVSATPSIETWRNAAQGKFTQVKLSARHAGAALPDIRMVDMRLYPLPAETYLSPPLVEALKDTLAAGKQAMLFLNRRGYAPLMLCRACGHRMQCPHCTAWLVSHKRRARPGGRNIPSPAGGGLGRGPACSSLSLGAMHAPLPTSPLRGEEQARRKQAGIQPGEIQKLECHHCGFQTAPPPACPSCQAEGKLHALGPGVEKLAEEVQALFPALETAVLSSDSTENLKSLGSQIERFEKGELPLIIGTQVIAKGHHFPGLALVGVIDADLGLMGGDLRAGERTYQLLHQMAGRAGREAVRGEVLIQSYCPDHPVMRALVSGEREAFMAAELACRRDSRMPPFTRLAALIVDGPVEERVIQAARAIARAAPQLKEITVYGPAPAPLALLRARHRWRLLIKSDRNINLQKWLAEWLTPIVLPSGVRVRVDVDPYSFL